MPKKKKKVKKHAPPVLKIAIGLSVVVAAAIILVLIFWPARPSGDGGGGKTTGTAQPSAWAEGVSNATLFVSCQLEGCLAPYTCEEGKLGGVARMSTVYRKWSQEVGDHIRVDIGNSTVVRHKEANTINSFVFSAFDQLGYDVVNCGDNEAALDLDDLLKLAQGRKFKLISANLVRADTRAPVFPQHHILRHRGQDIGFIGLVRDDIPTRRLGKGIRLISPSAALKNSVSTLKPKVDIIVVIAFLPVEDIYEMAKEQPHVGIFLGGYTPVSSAPYEIAGRPTKPTAIVSYLGDQGCSVGRLQAAFPKDLPPTAIAKAALLGEDVEPDPELTGLVAEFTAALSGQALPGSKQDPKMPCTSSYVGAEVCKLCHIKQFYSWQATDHAGSYATLLQQGKQKERACLGCHVTGYDMPGGYDPDRPVATRSKLEEEAEEDAKKRKAEEAKEKGEGAETKDAPKQPKAPQTQRPMQGVGCECCHGGARHHLGIALRDRFLAARSPLLRSPSALKNCLRCHHTQRPCHEAEAADPYDRTEYLEKIKHWE